MSATLERSEVEKYLLVAQERAIVSMSQNKWERFGYWAAMSVHLRKLLGLSNTASPFRDFAEMARRKVEEQGLKVSGD